MLVPSAVRRQGLVGDRPVPPDRLQAQRCATGRPGFPAVLSLQALGRLVLDPVRSIAGDPGEAQPAPSGAGELVGAVEAVTGVRLVVVAGLAISKFEPNSSKRRRFSCRGSG